MYRITQAQQASYQGIKTVYLRPGTYTLTEEYCYSFASSDGTMNYKSPFALKTGFQFIGLGDSPSDVVIDTGTFATGRGNSAFEMENDTVIKNLTINSTGGTKIACIKVFDGRSNILLDNVILNNNSSYAPAMNSYNGKNITIKNCQFNNLKSTNIFSPLFADFSDITITNTHLYSVYDTLSIAYNYREGTSYASTLNVDDTVTGAQGGSVDNPNTTGLVIYSAAPSDVYTDVVNINGIQIMHTDEVSKGTASNIDGWYAYDANDWDGRELIITYNYNGYLYTTREYTADEIKSALKAFNLLL